MPAPVSNNPIHLLRALLRQCRYLPDPHARTYIARQITSRYRVYHPPKSPFNYSPTPPERQKKLLRNARKALSTLTRANDGVIKSLMKILYHTYGRTGKRRRQLLDAVRLSNPPVNDEELALLISKEKQEEPTMSAKLEALVMSQLKSHPTNSARTALKKLKPNIPEKNIWLRPTPAKRVRNLKWRFHRDHILARVLPPLPEAEWVRLGELASGKRRWEGLAVRGARPKEEAPALTREYFELRTRAETRRKLRERDPQNITARYMRRMWGKIFEQCPVIRWDHEGRKWNVVWGSMRGLRPTRRVVDSKLEEGIFDGVDLNGRTVSNT
ncbi:MAG: hypothetical protein M1839_009027 [Geoglossum umbratile]|nr:MAG: hypothetical protein M1839_009027 [Geoglossum umbratile]